MTPRKGKSSAGASPSILETTGRETIARVTGDMNLKSDRDEASLYAAVLAAQDVAEKCRSLGISALHIKLEQLVKTKQKNSRPWSTISPAGQ